MQFDLGMAWSWEHDAAFIAELEEACRRRGRSIYQITPSNLEATLADLRAGRLDLCAYFDRAVDSDPRFLPLVEWARDNVRLGINPYGAAKHSWDKAAMHASLWPVVATAHTLVIPAHAEVPVLPALDLSELGPTFIIKPAHGGGGDGVVVEAHTPDDVLRARQEFPTDQYLLQSRVVPLTLDGRCAWFRVIFCTGEILPCWWDPRTHAYARLTPAEEDRYGLAGLRPMVRAIASVCQLQLFSTELALTAPEKLVVVDYVNDPIDLRPQSRCAAGVPDELVRVVADRIVALVAGAQP